LNFWVSEVDQRPIRLAVADQPVRMVVPQQRPFPCTLRFEPEARPHSLRTDRIDDRLEPVGELCRINPPRPEPLIGELQARFGVPPGVDRVHLGAGTRGAGNVGEQFALINVLTVPVPGVRHDWWRPHITRDRMEVLPNGSPSVAGERSHDDLGALRAFPTAHGKVETQKVMVTVFARRYLPAATPANPEPVPPWCP